MTRRAAVILPNFNGGGAERLTVDVMAGFVARGIAVDLVLLERKGDLLPLVPEGVRVIDLKVPRLRSAAGALRRYMRETRPDAVLALMWPLTFMTIVAATGLRHRPRVVVVEQVTLLKQYAASKLTIAQVRLTLALGYRFADAVTAASGALAKEVAELALLPQCRVQTIYNPIPPPLRSADGGDAWAGVLGKRIVTVGRLTAQKNHPLLLRAFAALARDTDATLAIVGIGNERANLEAMARDLGISGRLLLPGFTMAPGDWYAGADLFVLSSDYEGFGNVVVEALHCGLPVVTTDCPFGPSEIVDGGRWGALIPCGDAEALADAMRAALTNPVDPEGQKARAREFSVERGVDAYWNLMFPA